MFKLNGETAFHPKLYILKFTDFIRIVIGSGNMLSDDWNINGNVFFKKDFPLLGENQPCNQSEFSGYIQSYLKSILKRKVSLIESFLSINLQRYDLSLNSVALIGSLPGKAHSDNDFLLSYFRGK